MSSATLRTAEKKNAAGRAAAGRPPARTWWIMFQKEVQELWVSGKALVLLLVFGIILGVETWVFASNSELSLMPPKELVFETLSAALSISVLISLIIGADSISGERERATLEALLLTPTSRRQIVLGKFLGAMTIWPATLLIAIPFMYVLAQSDEAFVTGVVLGLTLGTVLAIGLTAVGMFVSFWCNSNKTSYFISLGIYLIFLLPAQLPGRAQKGFAGKLLQRSNPMASAMELLEKILVNNRTLGEFRINVYSPVIFAVLILALLFIYAAPRLNLEAGGIKWPWRRSRTASAALAVGLVLSLLFAAPALAQSETSASAAPAADSAPLSISINRDYELLKSGDPVLFDTVVTNTGDEASPPVIVAMNIINLDKEGDVVDPEDWSPQRTQYIDELGPGESGTLSWRVNAILDGDYLVYMVAMPQPAGAESTSQAVASQGVHLTVAPFHSLNPSGVLPYSIGVPAVLGLLLFYVYLRRRRGAMADAAAA
jgi:ABC-2 type transport system permease protein